MTNFALDKSTVDFHVRVHVPCLGEELMFEYELTVSPPQNGFMEAGVGLNRELLSVTGGAFAEKTILLENTAGRIRLLDEREFTRPRHSDPEQSPGLYRETSASTDATMLQRLYDEESNPRASHFKRYLAGWSHYDLSTVSMRAPIYRPGSPVLAVDGKNLASVLFMLKSSRERDYRRLLEVIKTIEPCLDAINFQGSERNVFMFFEDSDGHSLPAVSASDGTLRFLAIAYVLLMQPTNSLAPLYMIEESVASSLRSGEVAAIRDMSAAERLELAFRLGDEDLESFRATHGLDRRSAIRLLERRRQATRQASACLERLIG